MISKNQIKLIRSLHLKKARYEHRLFLAEGTKGVLEAAAGPFKVDRIFAIQDWIDTYGRVVAEKEFPVEPVTVAEMERITALSTPGPALALIRMKEDSALFVPPLADSLVLVLDEIQDPGNLGTIIRIADWFGIKKVFCSPGTVEFYNPKVIQSTMGSFCRVEVQYAALPALLSSSGLPRRVYGTFLDGTGIYDHELSPSGLIVIGNESRGISAEVEKFVTDRITIPSYSHNQNELYHAESLNAAIAAAIVCAEFRRRQKA